MNAAAAMTGAGIVSWAALLLLVAPAARPAVSMGMAGPLVAAAGSWLLIERTHERNPGAVMSVMIASFAAKLLFFGAYVAVAMRVMALRPVPFVASFAGYLVALYVMEALYLRRLFR